MNEKLFGVAECGRRRDETMICCGMRIMFVITIVVMIRNRLVMFRVNCFTVFMRFEHDMHVRIKKKNEIPNQRYCTAKAQPNRFLFSRSHSSQFSRPRPIVRTGDDGASSISAPQRGGSEC